MLTIFEKSREGRGINLFDSCDVPMYSLDDKFLRKEKAKLPEINELALLRHYTALSKRAYGVEDGIYPLGSCTMKYNPKINERVAQMRGFTNIHPLQNNVDGAKEVMLSLGEKLCTITGMDAFTLQPAAGAHGEYTAMQIIKAYHVSRGDFNRIKVIVPDSAHGTNPASAAMVGFEIINIPSNNEGCVDLDRLLEAVGSDTACLMLTNPNTVGIFDKNIKKISDIVHNAGGLVYYDGANLNAIMGRIRPGDMGYDVVHLNLHKTFSTPHGGGGPGSGPVGCKSFLEDFLPDIGIKRTEKGGIFIKPEKSIGSVKTFFGNFLVCLRALCYLEVLGTEGIKEASASAVLNANYMMTRLKSYFPCYSGNFCMHEFVISCEKLKEETGISALTLAKAMIDRGIHPPTMYFPLIVHEALMFEPTETEDKESLDNAVSIILALYEKAHIAPEELENSPTTMPIGRPDEVLAARKPVTVQPS